MDITVQKYGGSSLATDRQLDAVAERVALEHRNGVPLIIVVSARGDTTDQLIHAANMISAAPCPNETDKLLATGELAAARTPRRSRRPSRSPTVASTRLACHEHSAAHDGPARGAPAPGRSVRRSEQSRRGVRAGGEP